MSESWAPGWPGSLDGFWSWQARGACRATEARLFFSPDGERGPARQAREHAAKAICARCLVVDVCGAYAVAAREWHGVWGGLSEVDRWRIWQRADQADLQWRYRRARAAWDTTSVSGVRGASGAG
jgi:WhiB family transcriptional regulator, redox-sensing transcriptional regulator